MVDALGSVTAAHQALLHAWRGVGERMLLGTERLTMLNARHAGALYDAACRTTPGADGADRDATAGASADDPQSAPLGLAFDYLNQAFGIQLETATEVADVLARHAHDGFALQMAWIDAMRPWVPAGALPLLGTALDTLDLTCRAVENANAYAEVVGETGSAPSSSGPSPDRRAA